MRRNRMLPLAAVAAAALVACSVQSARAQRLPDDSVVLALLKQRVALGRNPGIVVGLVDARGQRVVAWGTSGRAGVPLDGATEFEIGSITKVFTSTLLADAIARGVVTPEEPVAKLLPARVKVPSYQGREITLVDLATHSSGLPRLPSNLKPANPLNPY
ncbi:MAG TPA: serine hydrolase, partial [Longimicrobiales bacterium]